MEEKKEDNEGGSVLYLICNRDALWWPDLRSEGGGILFWRRDHLVVALLSQGMIEARLQGRQRSGPSSP